MSMIRSLTALLVLVASAPLVSAGTTSVETGTSPKICNCTSGEVELQICHQSKVTVTKSVDFNLGSLVGSFTGGWSSVEQTGQSTCATSKLKPGSCQFFEYTYNCVYETYWFSAFNSKDCTLATTVLKEVPATAADCRS